MTIEIISWVAVGLVTGSLARIVMPGPAAGGIRVAVLIGLLGAVAGGFVSTALLTSSNPFGLSLGMATNGALYSLFVYRCVALRFRAEDLYHATNANRAIVQPSPIYSASIDFGEIARIAGEKTR